jgi:hypothetical protein
MLEWQSPTAQAMLHQVSSMLFGVEVNHENKMV